MTEYPRVGYEEARQIVKDAKENKKVLQLDRIGASPYLAYTPYTNNEGVTINMWSCISYTFRAMPENTLLGHPTIIKPEDHDDWEVRIITTEWVIGQVAKTRNVTVESWGESPFGGNVVGGWND